jgi:hypothetical protein
MYSSPRLRFVQTVSALYRRLRFVRFVQSFVRTSLDEGKSGLTTMSAKNYPVMAPFPLSENPQHFSRRETLCVRRSLSLRSLSLYAVSLRKGNLLARQPIEPLLRRVLKVAHHHYDAPLFVGCAQVSSSLTRCAGASTAQLTHSLSFFFFFFFFFRGVRLVPVELTQERPHGAREAVAARA